MRDLPVIRNERLLAAWGRGEDAALWRIDDRRLGILTVDFITPVVDDPFNYGEIAAANSLSDVWAMGGRPIIALNVVCFPTSCEPIETLKQILLGGAAKAQEAGAMLAGGHSVQDAEPKFGMVVFGEVEADLAWKTSGAQPGDALIITKPLGTGLAVTAIKAELLAKEYAEAAYRSMSALNDIISATDEGDRTHIRACTDVTGFGFAGHALDMTADDQDLIVRLDALPTLPGIVETANMGLIPAGTYSNKDHSSPRVSIETDADKRRTAEDIIYDPQTSGGLLLAVDPTHAERICAKLKKRFPSSAIAGRFEPGGGMLRIK